MMKGLLAVLFFAGVLPSIHAQTTAANPPLPEAESRVRRVAEGFVAAYNRQDFEAMRADFSPLLKVFLRKGAWAKSWRAKYARYGAVATPPQAIRAEAGGSVSIPLAYTADSTLVRESLTMYVHPKRGVIQGFGITQDAYAISPLQVSRAALDTAVDSVLTQAFPAGFNGTVLMGAGGQTFFVKSCGYADFGRRTPLTDSSVFNLASLSKQFTAAAILKLHEMGRLNVDDSLQKFFPELHGFPGVRVRHLIHHTAGLPDYEAYVASRKVAKPFADNRDVIAMLATRKADPTRPPGTRYKYSNTGYAVLAGIVEKASGTSYADFLAKHFFQPLGMMHTRVYSTRWSKRDTVAGYAYGYVWSGKQRRYISPDSLRDSRYVVKLDGVVGQGRVSSTARDLLKWAEAMTRPGAVLADASLRAITTPDTLAGGRVHAYGFGVEIERRPATGLVIAHTGGWPGYQTLLYRFPEKGDKVLVILSNKRHPDDDLLDASRRLAGLLLGM